MNITAISDVLNPSLGETLSWITTGFKVFLGIVGIYFIFWIINMIINHRKNKMLKEILVNVKEINVKLGKKSKK